MKKNFIYNMFILLIAMLIFVLMLNGLFWIELSILRYWKFENIIADINAFSAISIMSVFIFLPYYIAGKVALGFANIFGSPKTNKTKIKRRATTYGKIRRK